MDCCPRCDAAVDPGDSYCSKCGYQINGHGADNSSESAEGYIDLYEESVDIQFKMLSYTWPFIATQIVIALVSYMFPAVIGPITTGNTVGWLVSFFGIPAAINIVYYHLILSKK